MDRFSTGTGNGGGNAGIVPGTNFGLSPTDGNQAFSFNGDNPPAGTWIEQTFSTQPGQLYFLRFDVGRNNGFADQTLRLQVQLFDGASFQIGFGQFTPPLTIGYTSDQLGFIPTSTTTRLRFTNISGSNPNTDLFLDNVSVALQVPEPSASALAILGLATLLVLRSVRRPIFRSARGWAAPSPDPSTIENPGGIRDNSPAIYRWVTATKPSASPVRDG